MHLYLIETFESLDLHSKFIFHKRNSAPYTAQLSNQTNPNPPEARKVNYNLQHFYQSIPSTSTDGSATIRRRKHLSSPQIHFSGAVIAWRVICYDCLPGEKSFRTSELYNWIKDTGGVKAAWSRTPNGRIILRDFRFGESKPLSKCRVWKLLTWFSSALECCFSAGRIT